MRRSTVTVVPATLLVALAGVSHAADAVEVRSGLPRLHGILAAAGRADGQSRQTDAVDGSPAARPVARIAYLGGSITGGSWRTAVTAWLQRRHPQVEFQEISAAVGGTGSGYGAHRIHADVLRHRPDVVFVEFAVNDAQGGLREAAVATMEAIVRSAKAATPAPDVCLVYFPMQTQLPLFLEGELPEIVRFHDRVAAQYRLPSIALGPEVAARIQRGVLAWKAAAGATPPGFTVDGVHPDREGNALAAEIVTAGLATILERTTADAEEPLPPPLVADNPWLRAALVRPRDHAGRSDAWAVETIGQGVRRDVLRCKTPGRPLALEFTGGGDVLVKFLRGPRAGSLIVAVDDLPLRSVETHGPRDGVEDALRIDGLPEGRHTVTMRLREGATNTDDDAAIRILEIRFFGTVHDFGD